MELLLAKVKNASGRIGIFHIGNFKTFFHIFSLQEQCIQPPDTQYTSSTATKLSPSGWITQAQK